MPFYTEAQLNAKIQRMFTGLFKNQKRLYNNVFKAIEDNDGLRNSLMAIFHQHSDKIIDSEYVTTGFSALSDSTFDSVASIKDHKVQSEFIKKTVAILKNNNENETTKAIIETLTTQQPTIDRLTSEKDLVGSSPLFHFVKYALYIHMAKLTDNIESAIAKTNASLTLLESPLDLSDEQQQPVNNIKDLMEKIKPLQLLEEKISNAFEKFQPCLNYYKECSDGSDDKRFKQAITMFYQKCTELKKSHMALTTGETFGNLCNLLNIILTEINKHPASLVFYTLLIDTLMKRIKTAMTRLNETTYHNTVDCKLTLPECDLHVLSPEFLDRKKQIKDKLDAISVETLKSKQDEIKDKYSTIINLFDNGITGKLSDNDDDDEYFNMEAIMELDSNVIQLKAEQGEVTQSLTELPSTLQTHWVRYFDIQKEDQQCSSNAAARLEYN